MFIQLAISFITASLLIILGFISVKKPKIIAGYSKLDAKQKENTPILVKRASLIMGIVILIGGIMSYFLKNDYIFLITYALPLFVMPLYILHKSGGLSNKRTKIIFYFLFIPLFIIPIFLFLSSKEPVIAVYNNEVSISGLYGESIPSKEIKAVILQEDIPSIQLRTNGYALGKVRKGYFNIERLGNVKLFLSNNQGPYINILTNDNRYIIINFNDSAQTRKLYIQLKSIE